MKSNYTKHGDGNCLLSRLAPCSIITIAVKLILTNSLVKI